MAYFSMQQRRYKEKEKTKRSVDASGLVHVSITHSRNRKPVNTVNTVIAGLLLSVSIFTAIAPNVAYADTVPTNTATTSISQSVAVDSATFADMHRGTNAVRAAIKTGSISVTQLKVLLVSLTTLEDQLNNDMISDSLGLLDVLTNMNVLSEQLGELNDTELNGLISEYTQTVGGLVTLGIETDLLAFANDDVITTVNGKTTTMASLRPKYENAITAPVAVTKDVVQIGSTQTTLAAVSATEGDFANFKKVNTYTAQTFNDFTLKNWYAPFVQYAYETGILEGKGAGKFDPQGNLTIAEAITLAAKVNKVYYGEHPVFAAGDTNWYDNIVKYAISNGMIKSTEFAGKYGQPATRAQMVYIFSKALPADTFKAINADFDIPDVDGRTTYNDKIQMFYDSGILAGSDKAGNFQPTARISRAEAATIINKVAKPSARVVREAPVVAPVETKVDVPWTVGTVKVQVSVDLNGNPVYRNKEQGAVLIKKGTLVAKGIYAKEDYYSMSTHSYGAATQEEYNQVIQIMQDAYDKIEFKNIKDAPGYHSLLIPYVNGTLTGDALASVEQSYSSHQLQLLKDGKIVDFVQTAHIAMMQIELNSVRQEILNTNSNLSTESAFGYLSSNLHTDCNGSAQANLALLDYLGFTDAFIASNQTHAWAVSYYDGLFGGTQYLTTNFEFRAASGIVVKPIKTTHGITPGDYYNSSYNFSN